jgi:hypothetical protein
MLANLRRELSRHITHTSHGCHYDGCEDPGIHMHTASFCGLEYVVYYCDKHKTGKHSSSFETKDFESI